MKKIVNKMRYIKIIGIFLLIAALVLSNLSAIANTNINTKTQNIKINEMPNLPSKPIRDEPGYEIVLSENFTDGNIPPEGDQGTWTHIQTNQDETWYIDGSDPYSEPYCGTVHRDESDELLDEWLITPSLDFSEYVGKEILLKFHWYTDYYVSAHMDYIDLNVSISTNGGINWTKIWTEDDISGVFPTWEWIDTNMNDPIDLSIYGGESNVKIAFQFYSNSTEQSDYQEFSIDDIFILAEGVPPLECSLGGPYEWWWPIQYDYDPPGVRFHGSVNPTGMGYHWFWDFDDGNTSTLPYFPIHFFNEVKTYNVTLRITDNSYNPPRYHENHTLVKFFLLKPPDIDINIQKMSLGIKADIENVCEYNASYVNWSMTVHWGLRQAFSKVVANNTIEVIPPKSSTAIQSPLYFFGFGRIHIDILAEPENLPDVIKHFDALKIGPFVFNAK